MKIALGSDHRGDVTAGAVAAGLRGSGHEIVLQVGCEGRSCDYPDQAWAVGRAVADGQADRGVLICGSGIGVCIAANKVPGVRAALIFDEFGANLSRTHNDANVVCLSADATPERDMLAILKAWLSAEFEGGRHARRVRKIEAIERGEDPASVRADAVAT